MIIDGPPLELVTGVACQGAAETVERGAVCGVEFGGMLMQRRWCCPRRAMNGVVSACRSVYAFKLDMISCIFSKASSLKQILMWFMLIKSAMLFLSSGIKGEIKVGIKGVCFTKKANIMQC